MSLLGGFGRSAHTRGWAVLDGLRSKELMMSYYSCTEEFKKFKFTTETCIVLKQGNRW